MMCLPGLRAASVWWLASAMFFGAASSVGAGELMTPKDTDRIAAIRGSKSAQAASIPSHDALRPATASSDNFVILVSPDGRHAARVLEEAETCRDRIARAWLGRVLPAGKPQTFIDVKLASEKDTGLTLPPIAKHDASPRIWLASPDEEALRHALSHEMVHVVMLERFPAGMPAWANEGAASLEDAPVRVRLRTQLLSQWSRTESWPSLGRLMDRPSIPPSDLPAYAQAASFVEYLTQQESRETFLQFVKLGQRDGWNAAARQCYRFVDVTEMERNWQRWVRQRLAADERALSAAARIREQK